MSKKRILIGYLLGFISALLIVVLVILLVFKFTIGSQKYVFSLLERDNYYEKINEEIKEEMNLHLLSSGFSNEIIKDVYEYTDLVDDIKLFVDNSYDGKLTNIDNSNIYNKIMNNINDFFKENKIYTVNQSDLKSFVNELTDIYSDEVNLYHFADSIIPKIPKINKLINILTIIISIVLIALIMLLAKIKYLYFGGTVISSGLIILFIHMFVFERIDVNNLLIITEKFSYELREVLSVIENLILVLGISLIIIGIILTIVNICVKKKKKVLNN